ncbi:Crossover junction endonuclease MUS81 [Linum grandiflorum]
MDNRKWVLCPDNEVLASCLLEKRKELADSPKGLSDNLDMTLSKAYTSVCSARTPIKTLKEFSQLKYVCSFTTYWNFTFYQYRLLSGFNCHLLYRVLPEFMVGMTKIDHLTIFESSSYRSIGNWMLKQMQTFFKDASVCIIHQSASSFSFVIFVLMLFLEMFFLYFRYMLTQEGEDVAKECLARSRMPDPMETFAGAKDSSNMDINYIADDESDQLQPTPPKVTIRSEDLSGQERSLDVPPQSLERVTFLQLLTYVAYFICAFLF